MRAFSLGMFNFEVGSVEADNDDGGGDDDDDANDNGDDDDGADSAASASSDRSASGVRPARGDAELLFAASRGHVPALTTAAAVRGEEAIRRPRCKSAHWRNGERSQYRRATLVHLAAYACRLEALTCIVDQFGADPGAVTKEGLNALHWAALSGCGERAPATIDWLLEQGLDVAAVNQNGNSAIHYAAST